MEAEQRGAWGGSAQKESLGGNALHLTHMASAWELRFGKNMEIIALLIFKVLFVH